MPTLPAKKPTDLTGLSAPHRHALTVAEQLIGDDLVRHERQAVLDAFLVQCRSMTSAESCAVFLKPTPQSSHIVLEATLTDKFGHNFERGVTLHVTDTPRSGLSGYLATLRAPFRKHGADLRTCPWIAGHKPAHLRQQRCCSVMSAPLALASGDSLGYWRVTGS